MAQAGGMGTQAGSAAVVAVVSGVGGAAVHTRCLMALHRMVVVVMVILGAGRQGSEGAQATAARPRRRRFCVQMSWSRFLSTGANPRVFMEATLPC